MVLEYNSLIILNDVEHTWRNWCGPKVVFEIYSVSIKGQIKHKLIDVNLIWFFFLRVRRRSWQMSFKRANAFQSGAMIAINSFDDRRRIFTSTATRLAPLPRLGLPPNWIHLNTRSATEKRGIISHLPLISDFMRLSIVNPHFQFPSPSASQLLIRSSTKLVQIVLDDVS